MSIQPVAQIIRGATFGTPLPADPAINEGTIVVLDPMQSGLPATGVLNALPNLASAQAEALAVGAGADWVINAATPSTLSRGRSAKGGIYHGWKGGAVTAGGRLDYIAPAALNTWAQGHRSTPIYASVTMRVVRVRSDVGGTGGAAVGFADGNGGNGRFQTHSNMSAGAYHRHNPTGGVQLIGSTADVPMVAGTLRTLAIAATDVTAVVSLWRAFTLSASSTTSPGTCAVFYRAVFERLAVSGLSFGDALDRDQEIAERVTTHGLYADDAWESPATFAPLT